MLTFKNMDLAWSHMAKKVLEEGKNIAGTHELNNVLFKITDINDNILKTRHNFSLPYYLGEGIWYATGSNSKEFISKFGKIWDYLSDDGITNESAYGYILKNKYGFDQIEKMIELFKTDEDSRRGVMNINFARENVIETNDEQCTIALQVIVRDGRVNMTGIMRSNDLWTGTPYDIFYFTEIQKYIANRLGLKYGTYTHFVTSLHIYDRDVEKIEISIDNFYNNYGVDIQIDGQKLFEYADYFYEILEKIESPKEVKAKAVELAKEYGIVGGKYVED